MTTCAQAAQAHLWADGGYIHWSRVHAFLCAKVRRLIVRANEGIGGPGGSIQEQAAQAELLLTTLEMLFGADLLNPESYPGHRARMDVASKLTEPLEDEELLALLKLVVLGQAPGRPPDPIPRNPSESISISSGATGWWTTDIPDSPKEEHFVTSSALCWMCLRRNRTGLERLGVGEATALQNRPPSVVLPVSLEPKIGGNPADPRTLSGIGPWMRALRESLAIPRPAAAPGVPYPLELGPILDGQHPANFWGEVIGVVLLFQALQDTAQDYARAVDANRVVPPLSAATGMGHMFASAFRWWQQRRFPPLLADDIPSGFPKAGESAGPISWEAESGPQGFEDSAQYESDWGRWVNIVEQPDSAVAIPGTNGVFRQAVPMQMVPVGTGYIFPFACPTGGQDVHPRQAP